VIKLTLALDSVPAEARELWIKPELIASVQVYLDGYGKWQTWVEVAHVPGRQYYIVQETVAEVLDLLKVAR